MDAINGGRLGAMRRQDVLAAWGSRKLRAAEDAGILAQPWRGVLVHATRLDDPWTRASAALLAIDDHGVISDRTALALHGCAVAASPRVHVTVPYSRAARSRPELVVHHNKYTAAEATELRGLPVLTLERALADTLCGRDRMLALAAADQVLGSLRDAAEQERLRAALWRQIRTRDDPRGVSSASLLMSLITGKADSPPESYFRLIVVEAGFPIPVPQHEIRSITGRLVYVLDMAWPKRRIALEYDGYDAHETRKERDAQRDERLRRHGWIVIRATAADLSDPTRVIRELRAAFDSRSR